MPYWVIHLYWRDPEADPPVDRDLGIPPIRLPASNLAGIEVFARTALIARLGYGRRNPNAGHVVDQSGHVKMRLRHVGSEVVEVEMIDGSEI